MPTTPKYLRLRKPATGARRYALRNVYVLGPRTADERGVAQPSTAADEAARASVRRLLEAVETPIAPPTVTLPPPTVTLPPPPKPREPSYIFSAIEQKRALNLQAAARVPPIATGIAGVPML